MTPGVILAAFSALALQTAPAAEPVAQPAAAQPQPSAAAAPATPPLADDSTTTVSEVVVVASPIEALRSFVGEISAPASEGQLARWDRKICPGVLGLSARHAAYLNDRLAVAAYRVGLDVGEPGCRPNIFIGFTRDAGALAADIVKDNPGLVDKYGQEGGTRGRRALRDFVETPRPVRWWHVTRTVTSDGFVVRPGEQVTVRSAGRVSRTTRQDFDRMIVLVDTSKVGVVRFGALADYVAMVALAQVDPTADTEGYSTILNLFADRDAGREPPEALTDWDVAYLQGLYQARRDALNDRRQQSDIVRRMREGETPAQRRERERREALVREEAAKKEGEGASTTPPTGND